LQIIGELSQAFPLPRAGFGAVHILCLLYLVSLDVSSSMSVSNVISSTDTIGTDASRSAQMVSIRVPEYELPAMAEKNKGQIHGDSESDFTWIFP